MSEIVERLARLVRHLAHLRELRPRVTGREALQRDLSLHNDVLFSLLMVCQLVIDMAGELSARAASRSAITPKPSGISAPTHASRHGW